MKTKEQRFEKVIEDEYKVDNLWWVVCLSVILEYFIYLYYPLDHLLLRLLFVFLSGFSGVLALFIILTNYNERKVYWRRIK